MKIIEESNHLADMVWCTGRKLVDDPISNQQVYVTHNGIERWYQLPTFKVIISAISPSCTPELCPEHSRICLMPAANAPL